MENRNRVTDTREKLMVTTGERGEGRDKLGLWVLQTQTTIHKADMQQGFAI